MTHPYFIAKAADVLARAGAAPGVDATPLAEWAEQRHADVRQGSDPDAGRRGVIVDHNGRVVAETWRSDVAGVGADYITEILVALDEDVARHIRNCEAGLGIGALCKALGVLAIHVRYSEVAQGRAPRDAQ